MVIMFFYSNFDLFYCGYAENAAWMEEKRSSSVGTAAEDEG